MAEEVIQKTITEAPEYLQPGIDKYLQGLTLQAGQALDTSKFAPQVAGLGALQQDVQQQLATQAGLGTLQFGPEGQVTGISGAGVAGFQPFLDRATADVGAARTTLGDVSPFITAAGTGVGRAEAEVDRQSKLVGPSAFQQFESPYQAAVRDATLKSFEEQRNVRRQNIRDEATRLGALGAGRTGVQLAEYDRKSDIDRALLVAQLNQAGFTQAQDLANRAFGQRGQLASNQLGLGQAQLGLGQATAGLAGQQTGLAGSELGLGQAQSQLAGQGLGIAQGLGQSDLAFRQALKDQQQQANRMAALEPIERLARFGQGLTGVGGMMGSVQTVMGQPQPVPSPLSGALQAGIGAFTLGKLFG